MTYKEIMENVVSIKWMNEQIMNIGNEDAEEIWLMDYPDGADYQDLVEMAKDPQIMEWLSSTYRRIKHLESEGLLGAF